MNLPKSERKTQHCYCGTETLTHKTCQLHDENGVGLVKLARTKHEYSVLRLLTILMSNYFHKI